MVLDIKLLKCNNILFKISNYLILDEGSEEGENALDSKDENEKKKKSKSKKEISLGDLIYYLI